MDSVLASSAVSRGFESRSGQTKDYEIGTTYRTRGEYAIHYDTDVVQKMR
jgi:hypothetical protein